MAGVQPMRRLGLPGFPSVSQPECGFPVGEGQSAGGRWKVASRNGVSLWWLPADEHEVSGFFLKCSKKQSEIYMRFQSIPDSADGKTALLSIGLNGAAARPESIEMENGYLYPDVDMFAGLMTANDVKIGYQSGSLNRRLTFHPQGLNLADIQSACGL